MKIKLFIPYANGDCINGFKYDKPITRQQYIEQESKEWKERRYGVHEMVTNPETERLGYNIAINPWEKRKYNCQQQTFTYHECEALVYNIDEQELTLSILDELYRKNNQTNEGFMLYVYLNTRQINDMVNPDLVTDFNQWAHESMNLWGLTEDPDYCDQFDETEVMKYLPTKDFKMWIKDDNSTAVLRGCKFIQPMDEKYSFAMLVDKIRFIKEDNSEKQDKK